MTMSYLDKVQPVDNWTQMYYKYKPNVYSRLRKLSPEEKADIFGNLYFECKKAERSWKEGKGFSRLSWYFLYVRSYIQKCLRRILNKRATEISIDQIDEASDKCSLYSTQSNHSIESLVDRNILRQKVQALINSIPERYAEVLRMFYGIGVSAKNQYEIAGYLNISQTGVRYLIERGKQYIESKIQHDENYINIGELLDYDA